MNKPIYLRPGPLFAGLAFFFACMLVPEFIDTYLSEKHVYLYVQNKSSARWVVESTLEPEPVRFLARPAQNTLINIPIEALDTPEGIIRIYPEGGDASTVQEITMGQLNLSLEQKTRIICINPSSSIDLDCKLSPIQPGTQSL